MHGNHVIPERDLFSFVLRNLGRLIGGVVADCFEVHHLLADLLSSPFLGIATTYALPVSASLYHPFIPQFSPPIIRSVQFQLTPLLKPSTSNRDTG